MSTKKFLVKNTFRQVQFVCRETITFFFRAVVPYKDLSYFGRYLNTFWKITVLKDAKARFLFKLYFTVLLYVLALYTGLYLRYLLALPVPPLARLVLFDPFIILNLQSQLYPLEVYMIAFSLACHWLLYCRTEGVPLNVIAEAAIFGKKRTGVVTVPAFVFRKYVFFDQIFTRQTILPQVLRITNLLQAFMFVIDPFLVAFLAFYGKKTAGYLLSSSLSLQLTFAALLPVLLLHIVFFFTFVISFVYIIMFLGTYGFVSLLYLITAFRRNIVHLREATVVAMDGAGRGQCLQKKILKALQRNIHLFEVIFISNKFYARLFLLYLAPHLPFSAYYGIQIAFGRFSGSPLFIVLVFFSEALLGILIIHLVIGYLSSVAHQGGKLLLSFIASQSRASGPSTFLPARLKCHLLLMHIGRLHVKKKYGISYGALGTLVTIKSFSKCLLVWVELLMYSYTLSRNG